MATFNPGIKVRTNGVDGTDLVPGIYTVEKHENGFVTVKEVHGGWCDFRFELEPERAGHGFVLGEIDD